MDYQQHLDRLKAQYRHVMPHGDHYYAVYPLAFHWTMIYGRVEDVTGYDDRWCYASESLALGSYLEWAERDFKGDPLGWHRHPSTGRRREDGDPSKEYIAW